MRMSVPQVYLLFSTLKCYEVIIITPADSYSSAERGNSKKKINYKCYELVWKIFQPSQEISIYENICVAVLFYHLINNSSSKPYHLNNTSL